MSDVELSKMLNGVEKEDQDKCGKKRKKKRSSMQMAKKYARRSERQQHGTEVDSETYQYMVRILDMLRDGFPTIDEKLIFVNNVYEQTIEHELEYARHQVGSRVLDSMMDYASYQVVQRLADAFGESLRPICSDRFASHVLEKIIHVCANRATQNAQVKTEATAQINENSIAVDPCDIPKYNSIAMKLCKYVINNFEEFVWDTYANHVLRTAIESLGGILEKQKDSSKQVTILNSTQRRCVPQEYTDLLVDVANRFLNWPQFIEFGKDQLTSGLLQTLLHTLEGVDSKLNGSIIKRIIGECFSSENTDKELSSIFHTESSIRLLEVCLEVAKPKMFSRIYKKLFAKRLRELSLMSSANFTVQRLMDYCSSKEIMEEIFDELSEHFVAIFDRKNTGIFASMANACLRLQCKQGPFVNLISKTLGCDESDEAQLFIVPVVSSLDRYEKLIESRKANVNSKISVHLHGSIVVQAMLRFNKPIKIVNSLLAMSGEELSSLMSDPKGSRILDAFMESKFIGEKSREKLAKTLQGNWVNLACGIHGSRCLEKIWQWSKTNQRYWIMEELAAVGQSLNSTKTGRLIYTKFNVALYARSKKDWTETQAKQEKTKALFSSIVDAD